MVARRRGRKAATLGNRLILQMALRLAAVIIFITGVSYWLVYHDVTASDLESLETYVAERGARESQVFHLAESNLATMMRSFMEEERQPHPSVVSEDVFEQFFEKNPDGAWRRQSGYDVKREPSAIIPAHVELTSDAKQRMLRTLALVRDYGRAWNSSFATVFFADMDGMAAIYWPGVDWYKSVAADAHFSDYPWAVAANPANDPTRGPVWTGIWYDHVGNGWFATCILPQDVDGRFRYYAGASLSLESILERTQAKRLPGTENVLFREDGMIISHPRQEIMDTLKSRGGVFTITDSGDPHLEAIQAAVRKAGGKGVIELEEYGEYLGVTRIAGPGWYLVTVLPKEEIGRSAFATAKVTLWMGMLALLVELVVVGWMIRYRVSRPLTHFVEQLSAFGEGKADARVDLRSDDELGRLAKTFNTMADTISKDRKELRGYAKVLEQKVAERTSQLETRDRAKTRFLAAASHDLRQPIQAIGLFLDSLRRSELDAAQQRIVQHIDHSVVSLKDLLGSLLDISRLDAGAVVPVFHPMPISKLFARLDAEFSRLALEQGLRFKFYFPHRETWVLTDERLLSVVLRNLVANALKYTPKGGLLVGTRRRGELLAIQVWDTGLGIEEQHLERIFEEFYQVANQQRDQAEGLGLGLAIASRTAQILKSPLHCKSWHGQGSMFEICLPLCQESDVATVDELSSETTALSCRGKKIVVVEDDARVADALVQWLESMGAEVHRYVDASAALAAPDVDTADAYISDFRLPGNMNGIEFLETLVKRRKGLTVRGVIITGDTSPDFIALAATCPWRILHKPVDPMQLLKVLEME
jgi:signal transduction histidine kinase